MKKVKLIKFDSPIGNGETSVRVHMDSSLVELGAQAFSIVNVGCSSPCLGEQGWQASENRFVLQIDPIIREAFLMPQSVHSVLDSSTNYQLVFFNALSAPVAEGVLRIKGGVGRRKSPVIVSGAHATPSPYEFTASTGRKGEFDVVAIASPDLSELKDIQSFLGGDESSIAAAPIFEQLLESQAEPNFSVPIARGESSSQPEIRARAVPSRCKNPGCEASIVSSMKVCPFCGSAQ